MMKFWTTKNKKIIASVGLAVSGWHVLTMGANPLSIPAQPAWVSNPLFAGISLLTVAGVVTVAAAIMVWTEY